MMCEAGAEITAGHAELPQALCAWCRTASHPAVNMITCRLQRDGFPQAQVAHRRRPTARHQHLLQKLRLLSKIFKSGWANH